MITQEELISFGMEHTTDVVIPYQKQITDIDGDAMYLIVHHYYNSPVFALCLAGGTLINLQGIDTIDDLKKFESYIQGYEPNY